MKKLILTIGITLLVVAGCSNNDAFDKAKKQGDLALENKEYDRAVASFELALKENKDDREVRLKMNQTNKMIEVLQESNIDRAISLLREIENDSASSVILAKQAKEKREVLANQKDEEEKYKQMLAQVEELKNQQKFVDVKEQLNVIIRETKGKEQFKVYYQNANEQITQIVPRAIDVDKRKDENLKEEKVKEENKNEEKPKVEEPKKESAITGQKVEYITKLNSIEESLKKLDYLYEKGITTEMKEGESKRYEAWDNALNEIYGVLKMQLPTKEMNTLREKQREWITYRDQKAEEAWNESGQGTLSGLASISSNVNSTKERCYQLVEQYMK
ncbi:lysozyme inhibitor LprI family protein [Bacillus hominis]|uniref:lysozyme inhibitor LprI family protein n=1 Tax=Bacillus hominis TaxID=2817478 RepID=UPI001BB3904F|nr:lysozyme inhibitor LprI family protein [Bacillus hominis]